MVPSVKKVKSFSHVWLIGPWTVAHQAPPSMGFSKQEYWSGLPFPSPGDLPNPGIKLQVSRIAGRRFTIWATREGTVFCKENCSLVSNSPSILCGHQVILFLFLFFFFRLCANMNSKFQIQWSISIHCNIALTSTQIISLLEAKVTLSWLLNSFDKFLIVFETFLDNTMTRCFSLILNIFCPWPGLSHFSKNL